MLKRALWALLPLAVLATPPSANSQTEIPTVKIEVGRLPDLNIPRFCHRTLCVDGEIVVIGGHTTGFKPTATAEYYRDGEWHAVQTLYTHDDGLAISLSSRRILVAGGYEKDFGIGQVFSAELYDPATHTCQPLGILDTKRAEPCGVELDSGRVFISGNWYNDDGIELFDGHQHFARVKDVAQQRAFPFIFRTDKDNAVIFGSRSIHIDEQLDSIIVDRLHGDAFMPPLFRKWKPLYLYMNACPDLSRIGDYAHLFPVADSTGQIAIALQQGEDFTLLTTDHPVPVKDIQWSTPVIADRQAHRAYIMGTGRKGHDMAGQLCVLAIDYAQSPARLTLYHADHPTDAGFSPPVLTADGDLLMAGGAMSDNFHVSPSVLLFRTGHYEGRSSYMMASARWRTWLWLLVAAMAVAVVIFYITKRQTDGTESPATLPQEGTGDLGDDKLMQRICELMERERIYLDSGLKVSDVANRLGVGSRRVSDCIKSQQNCLFAQFINTYRVEYAKNLLRNYPGIKMAAVWTGAGFSHESSFFRTFKAVTGMTPKEWMAKND